LYASYHTLIMSTTAACSRCGTPIQANDRFCARCGADVSGSQGAVATARSGSWSGAAGQTDPQQAALLEALRHATVGEYEILAELGRGGMATVYLANDLALGRKVAIKVMSPALQFMDGMSERFKREARTAASLSHPNIIPIYAVKQAEHVTYFVMKFIDGRSLDSIIKEVGPLPITMVQAISNQVGSALGHAHKRGIVHRDVKPANIMVDSDGWAVVTDFGIAKVAESHGLTMTGATVGTPSYMSPEQCGAGELSGSSDQYSLGVVIYEMLAGRVLFTGDSAMAVMYAHLHQPAPPIIELRREVPAELAAAVMRMLEKHASQRWPNMEAAVAAIGGGALAPDDPIRTELVTLAAAGTASQLLKRISTPVSAPPMGRTGGKTSEVAGLVIEPARVTIAIDGAVQFTAKVKSAGGGTQPGRGVTWASTDTEILTISEAGLATGIGAGSATITASFGKTSATATVVVTGARAKKKLGVWIGAGAAALVAIVLLVLRPWHSAPATSTGQTTVAAAPASSNNAATTTPNTGTPAASPPATHDSTAKPAVTPPVEKPIVRPPLPPPIEAASINVSPDRARLEANRTQVLRAVVKDGAGKVIQRAVQWRSSDPGVVEVSTSGVVTAVKPGRATVTASSDRARSAPVDVTVVAAAPAQPATLQLMIVPWGYVSIDGLPRGQKTRSAEKLPSGVTHRVHVERDGYAAVDTSITLQSGEERLLKIELRPKTK